VFLIISTWSWPNRASFVHFVILRDFIYQISISCHMGEIPFHVNPTFLCLAKYSDIDSIKIMAHLFYFYIFFFGGWGAI